MPSTASQGSQQGCLFCGLRIAFLWARRLTIWAVIGGSLTSCVNVEPLNVQRSLALEYLDPKRSNTELTDVPFFAQEAYQCGPSALATLLQYQGVDATPEGLSDQVYVPERLGSLQPLLIAAARSYGLLPYVRKGEGLANLFAEIEAGQPVLILQNLGLEFAPSWHYAVVVGWNPERERVILRSGTRKRQTHSLKFLEYTWRASQYWSLTLYDADDTPAQHTEASWLEAASGLESTGRLGAARLAYKTILEHYPGSFLAHMGFGNTAYRLADYAEAGDAYAKALPLSIYPAAAHHNLAWALIKQNQFTEAQIHAARAAHMDSRYSSARDFLRGFN